MYIEGLKVHVTPNALESTDEPIKVHIKTRSMSNNYHKRIQKKWIKRFGYKRRACIYQAGIHLFVHPSLYDEMISVLNQREHSNAILPTPFIS